MVGMGCAASLASIVLAAIFGAVPPDARAGAAAPDRVWLRSEAFVMGASLRIELEAETETEARRVIDRVFASVRALEGRWAAHAAGSELAGVNAAPVGTPVALSPDTWELLARAWHLSGRTDGAFEPTAAPLAAAWRDGTPGEPPSAEDLSRALAAVGRGCFDLSPASRTVARRCPDAWIDGAGVGRGAALARAAEVLGEERIERARVAFGSLWLVLGGAGSPRGEVTIPGVAAEGPALAWNGASGAFATAGRGTPAAPAVDPRAGSPVASWGSVTVRSPDPVEAEALATALFVMGPREALRWLAARPRVEALFLVAEEGGAVACGRQSALDAVRPASRGVRLSDGPELAPGLRSC